MDVVSYLLGKNSSGGGGSEKYFGSFIGQDNSAYNGVSLAIKEIPQDIIIEGTSARYLFANCINLIKVPILDTSSITHMGNMYSGCASLESIPLLDTSNVIYFSSMCMACTELKNVPILNTSKATNMTGMFNSCLKLTDESLDNILQMCIGATSYNGTKTLKQLGILNTSAYPTSRVQALPHYQDFVGAGWSIGY